MNPAQLHLALNHVPIILLPTALLLALAGLVRRSRELTTAGLLLTILVALVVLPVYFSGEGAEELVEHLPGVAHETIEDHEDAGKFAMITILVTGALAALALILGRGHPTGRGRTLLFLVLLAGAVASAAGVRTGHLGGLIRHPEIRAGAGSAPAEGGSSDGRDDSGYP